MDDKISVVIPVYKVEKYLGKCVDSILNQTYSNLEIILVDDGSPDNCPKICDEFQKKDNRVIVIHKKNGGLSDARNYGIEKATGDWITFVDSDDFVSNDYIEYLYTIADKNNADISILMPNVFYEKHKIKAKKIKEKIEVYEPNEALEVMLYQKKFDTSAWGKLYKRELISDIFFPVGKLYEDISTVYRIILNSKNVVYSNQEKYYYLKRKDSIMGRSFKEKDMDYIYQAEDMYNHLDFISNPSLEIAARCRVISANFSILKKILLRKEYKTYRTIIYNNLKNKRNNLLFNKNVRLKIKLAIILSYLNI